MASKKEDQHMAIFLPTHMFGKIIGARDFLGENDSRHDIFVMSCNIYIQTQQCFFMVLPAICFSAAKQQ